VKRNHLTAIAAALAIVLLGAALYFGPHWTVYRMRQAIVARDAQALVSHVDFPALRESLKAQLMLKLAGSGAGGGDGQKQNPFAALGQAFAAGLVGQLIDGIVTPDGVMLMMQAGKVSAAPAQAPPAAPPRTDAPAESRPKAPDYQLQYLDFSTVRIRAAQDQGTAFILRRHLVFGWKLSGVELNAK